MTNIDEGDESSEDETRNLVSILENRLGKLQGEVKRLHEENESLRTQSGIEEDYDRRNAPSSSKVGRGVWGSVANALESEVDFRKLGLTHSFDSVPSEKSWRRCCLGKLHHVNEEEEENVAMWTLEKLMQETEAALQSDDPERVTALQVEVDRRVADVTPGKWGIGS